MPRRPEQLLPYAALVNWTGAERLWQGQAALLDAQQGAAYAAGSGFRVPIGLGVSLMPFHSPYGAALQARSIALTTGRSVVAGFGPGARPLQRSVLGAPYRSPLTATREYLGAVRGLLAGETVDQRGEYHSCHGQLPPALTPEIRTGLGVLRPGMARVAGELADVAITWLAPPAYIRDTLVPALQAGARQAGRDTPTVTAVVPTALSRPERSPEQLALSSNRGHLQGPHYVDMLQKAGLDVSADDPEAGARALVAENAFVSGTAEEVAILFDEYRKAGVEEIVLNLTGVYNEFGPQAALDDTKSILSAVSA
ncbi:LLM class flavin-dependent oxidoreductase [Streptomonospora sediminis]